MVGCAYNEASVEKAIRSGELGFEIAVKANKEKNLHVRELSNTGIPYKVFTFSIDGNGYSVLVEGGNLIMLCSGIGGGEANEFVVTRLKKMTILTYHFTSGSGILYEHSGQYVIGSGKAQWDDLNKQKIGNTSNFFEAVLDSQQKKEPQQSSAP